MKFIQNTFSWNEIRSSHNLMILLIFTLGLFNFFWGEKVPAGGGLGWDGVNYAHMVKYLDSMVSQGQLSGYYAQRILPSAIVRGFMFLSGAPMTDVNIIKGFEIYNLTLLICACLVWRRVSNKFSLSLAGRWIGFSGIFVNFECSKQAFYYPVLTDVTALFIAMLLLLFYIEKRPLYLCLVTILGAFCWPVVSISGALLLLFINSEFPSKVITQVTWNFRFKSASLSLLSKIAIYFAITLPFIGFIAIKVIGQLSEYTCNVFNSGLKALENIVSLNAAQHLERVLNNNSCALQKFLISVGQFITALPSIYCLFVGLIILVGSASFFGSIFFNLRRVKLHVLLLAFAAIFIPFSIVKIISNPSISNESSLIFLIRWSLLPPEGKFFLPIVTLSVFWGPVLLLLMLHWEKFCVQVRKLGPGVVFVISISLLLGIANEPRFFTIGWPFFVLGLVLAMENIATNSSFKYVLVALTFLFAQFFLKINYSPWLGTDYDGLLEFPKQMYFMHYGSWMSWPSYALQFTVLFISLFLLNKTMSEVASKK